MLTKAFNPEISNEINNRLAGKSYSLEPDGKGNYYLVSGSDRFLGIVCIVPIGETNGFLVKGFKDIRSSAGRDQPQISNYHATKINLVSTIIAASGALYSHVAHQPGHDRTFC